MSGLSASAPKKLVIAYTRVSTTGQAIAGHSLETQRQLLKDYAEGHTLSIVRFFEETHSAYRPGRPEFDAMLAFLKKRSDVKSVLVYKLDRLWRNETDYAALAGMDDVELISATEAIPDGSTGRFMTTLMSATARLQSDQTSERVLHAAMKKVKDGGWPGMAPIGYINDRDNKTIEPDPLMGPLVKHLFETYAREDISLSQLVKRAKKLGLQTPKGNFLQKGSIHHMLTNPFYCGQIRWNNGTYPGNHLPLVSRALFDRVQDRLHKKHSPQKKRRFAYRGLMECARCGCTITASLIKSKYTYYHCTGGRGGCDRKYVSEDKISEKFGETLRVLQLSHEQTSFLLREITSRGIQLQSEARKRRLQLEREKKSLQFMRDRAYEDKLLGKISEDRWLKMERTWDEKLSGVEEQLALIDSDPTPALDEAEATFELLKRAPVLYKRQSHEERASFLRLLLSNSYLDGENLVPVYEKPFDLVAEGLKSSIWLPG